MSTQTRRVLDVADRPWAAPRGYQRFLGAYTRHSTAGIYFSANASPKQKKLLAGNFLKLPSQYQRLAREYGLTFSFCPLATANGNSSTFYADFNHHDRKKISPHVEMSKASLAPNLVLPHLTHELSHLWWQNLPEEARQRYRRFLQHVCDKHTVEVTEYTQDLFEEYLEELAQRDAFAAIRRQNALKSWGEESFCESVAVLYVPGYPGRVENTTIDLDLRRQKIEEITGLHLRRRQ